ncbi:MAG: hypothetical protein EPO40_11000 [Myxococcaceae bacterium]|nr:MAG: hypothetical protein EPO40_11000 [Myxococcaceae bacterium]
MEALGRQPPPPLVVGEHEAIADRGVGARVAGAHRRHGGRSHGRLGRSRRCPRPRGPRAAARRRRRHAQTPLQPASSVHVRGYAPALRSDTAPRRAHC